MAENNENMLKTKLKNKVMDEKLRETRANDIIEQNNILKDEADDIKERLCDMKKLQSQLKI